MVNMCYQVTHWPKDDYGKFYNGDSYIILNTYKEKESDVSINAQRVLFSSDLLAAECSIGAAL